MRPLPSEMSRLCEGDLICTHSGTSPTVPPVPSVPPWQVAVVFGQRFSNHGLRTLWGLVRARTAGPRPDSAGPERGLGIRVSDEFPKGAPAGPGPTLRESPSAGRARGPLRTPLYCPQG